MNICSFKVLPFTVKNFVPFILYGFVSKQIEYSIEKNIKVLK